MGLGQQRNVAVEDSLSGQRAGGTKIKIGAKDHCAWGVLPPDSRLPPLSALQTQDLKVRFP